MWILDELNCRQTLFKKLHHRRPQTVSPIAAYFLGEQPQNTDTEPQTSWKWFNSVWQISAAPTANLRSAATP